MFRAIGHASGAAMALCTLAGLAAERGDDASALAAYQEALRLWAGIGERWAIAWAFSGLAALAADHGPAGAGGDPRRRGRRPPGRERRRPVAERSPSLRSGGGGRAGRPRRGALRRTGLCRPGAPVRGGGYDRNGGCHPRRSSSSVRPGPGGVRCLDAHRPRARRASPAGRGAFGYKCQQAGPPARVSTPRTLASPY